MSITRTKLRHIIKAYGKFYGIPSWTKSVKAFAVELPATYGTVWRYLSGARKMGPIVQARIKTIAVAVGSEI